jgi:heme oxygenase
MQSLAQRLKVETRALHTAAERTRFMASLLRGELTRAAYCELLRNLYPIYAALEPSLERHCRHPAIAPVFLPVLWRTSRLADDLLELHGPSWPQAYELHPACARYVGRLHEIDAKQPMLLLAHAYVRFLGDLSGGQLLRPIVAAALQAPCGKGTAFHDFGSAAETLDLKRSFRAGLEGISVDADAADALVAEAKSAFALHCRLFDELAMACLPPGAQRGAAMQLSAAP